MMTIEHPCKICGKPAIAQFDQTAHPEAVDKFLPLLTHDRCSDIRISKRDSEEGIFTLCLKLEREKLTHESREAIRETLGFLTNKYAKALADLHESGSVIWSTQFANLLFDRPTQCGRILYEYREEVRRNAKRN